MENERERQACARKLRRLTKGTAQLIIDARAYFDAEARRERRKYVTKSIKRTATCLEVSETLVKKACKMNREGGELPSDTEKETRERARSVPEEYFEDIRTVTFAMYSEKKSVALDTLLDGLKAHRDLVCFDWMWSRATLHRVLTEGIAFTYDTRPSHYKTLHEQQPIALQRLNYTQQIRAYRAEGRPIWYKDETWVTKT